MMFLYNKKIIYLILLYNFHSQNEKIWFIYKKYLNEIIFNIIITFIIVWLLVINKMNTILFLINYYFNELDN